MVGLAEGHIVVGASEGDAVGITDGSWMLGPALGKTVGADDGLVEGDSVGALLMVGSTVGNGDMLG